LFVLRVQLGGEQKARARLRVIAARQCFLTCVDQFV
jgi:hypothetical protein